MRRRRDRYVRRRSALLHALIETGLMPADAKDAKALAVCDPYSLRKRALDERLEPYEIGRALFHLHHRRGLKSNRKDERKSGDEKESGKHATRSEARRVGKGCVSKGRYQWDPHSEKKNT